MKTLFIKSAYIIATGLLLTSCIKFEDKDAEPDRDTQDSLSTIKPTETAHTTTEITKAVYVYNDSTGKPEKSIDIPLNTTPENLVAAINKYNGIGKVELQFVKASNDTIYVKIADSAYLTQQMGTLGPHAYMATVTYTLTDLPNVKYVNFDFEEGDHASPGTYSRANFDN